MTDAELDALEAKAKAATPGPWVREGALLIFGPLHERSRYNNHRVFIAKVSAGRNRDDEFFSSDGVSITGDGKADAAFIAAANPAAVLDLIAELRQARAERDWLAEKNQDAPCELGMKCLHPDGRFKNNIPICDPAECWLELAAKEATCLRI